jgi:DNA-binding ferritin-like protein (Dps family)
LEHSDFTGRGLTLIVDGVLGLLETKAADWQSVAEALGDDIPGFCAAVAGEDGAKDYRDRWREQLNRTVARKRSRLDG